MIHVQTLDRKIWRKDLLAVHLYDCHLKDVDVEIDLSPEGCCAQSLGLYQILDEFCRTTGYTKNRITIKTANMIERHDEYNIIKQSSNWYEIGEIQTWLADKKLTITNTPSKHFANFSSRSNWARLWIATILDTNYSDKTIQTYHYDPLRENYNYNGYLGVDDLFKFNCDVISHAVEFLQTCPRTLDIDYLKDLDNCKNSKYQHENSYYPIQHPSHLNLLQYYNDIFVDIVAESNVSGNSFLVTEKLWRPIVARRPFIVIASPQYLNNLKKLGFKTFDTWWSEQYDLYGVDSRIKHIEQLLMIISTWDQDKLFLILQEMYSILEHNYQTFLNLNIKQIKDTFDV